MGVLLTAVFLSSCGAPQVPTTMKDVPRISVDELKERIDSGEAIVIGDTRVKTVFDINHIAGAISISSSQVEALLDDLPLDQEIVLYCTWPAEETSAGTALIMYESGYENVSVLLGGYEKWREAGYPEEKSDG